jgi:hypothetical protein
VADHLREAKENLLLVLGGTWKRAHKSTGPVLAKGASFWRVVALTPSTGYRFGSLHVTSKSTALDSWDCWYTNPSVGAGSHRVVGERVGEVACPVARIIVAYGMLTRKTVTLSSRDSLKKIRISCLIWTVLEIFWACIANPILSHRRVMQYGQFTKRLWLLILSECCSIEFRVIRCGLEISLII